MPHIPTENNDMGHGDDMNPFGWGNNSMNHNTKDRFGNMQNQDQQKQGQGNQGQENRYTNMNNNQNKNSNMGNNFRNTESQNKGLGSNMHKQDGQSIDAEKMEQEILDIVHKSWGSYCSSCGTKKSRTDLKVVKKVGPIMQIVSECKNCQLKTMISAVSTQLGLAVQVMQSRTDAKSNEFNKFAEKVTPYDYLDFYNQLKSIDNSRDLIGLINK